MSLTASLKAGHSTGKPDLLIFLVVPAGTYASSALPGI
jgi:hypothetical protein